MSLPKIAIFASIDNSANIFAFSILSVFCLAVKTVIQFYNLYSHISLMTRQSNVNLCNQQRCLTLPIILTAQWKRVKKKIEAYKDNLLLSSDGELRLITWLLRKNKMRQHTNWPNVKRKDCQYILNSRTISTNLTAFSAQLQQSCF